MSKAKNENERADPYRFQVREAEKSPVVLMYNTKQNEVLRKKLDFLESTKRTVVNRITINQKLTFIAYKKRLNKAKLAHAKLMGDKGEERDVRASGMKNSRSVGVNGLTQEDEEALRNIWKTAKPPPNLRESMGLARTVARSSSAKSIFRTNTTTYNISTPEPTVVSWSRPSTGFSKIRPPGVHSDDEDEVFEESEEVEVKGGEGEIKQTDKAGKLKVKFGDVDNNNNEYKARISSGSVTTLGGRPTNTVKMAWNQSSKGYATKAKQGNKPGSAPPERANDQLEPQASRPGTSSSAAPNIFEKDERPSLLDVHRERVKSADIPGRIDKLLDTMSIYMLDKRRPQRDCYSALLDKRAKDSYKRKCSLMGLNVIPDNHIQREMGNTDIRSLTVKPLKPVLMYK